MRNLGDNEDGFVVTIFIILVGIIGMSVISAMWSTVGIMGAIAVMAGVYLVVKSRGHPNKWAYILIVGGIILGFIGFALPESMQFSLPGADFIREVLIYS